jgi:hypothetical protein
MTAKIANEPNFLHQRDEYNSDPCCQEVLEFLRRHPRTRFSQLAIVHTLNRNRFYIERALTYLTASGVIKNCLLNNVTFYSLEAVLADRLE